MIDNQLIEKMATAVNKRSTGLLDQTRERIRIIQPKGKQLFSLGSPISGGCVDLYPEEALYLIELDQLEVFYTLEDTQAIAFPDIVPLLHAWIDSPATYAVYSYLQEHKYIAQRPTLEHIDLVSQEQDASSFIIPTFSVYPKSSSFKKSNPGMPAFMVLLLDYDQAFVSISSCRAWLKSPIPMKVALVDACASVLIFDLESGPSQLSIERGVQHPSMINAKS